MMIQLKVDQGFERLCGLGSFLATHLLRGVGFWFLATGGDPKGSLDY